MTVQASTPPHETRLKLLRVFGMVFETGKPKLTFIALEGMQVIIFVKLKRYVNRYFY